MGNILSTSSILSDVPYSNGDIDLDSLSEPPVLTIRQNCFISEETGYDDFWESYSVEWSIQYVRCSDERESFSRTPTVASTFSL